MYALQEIIYIMERDPDLHHINTEGFERNTAQKFTITIDSRDHRDLLKHHFENNPTGIVFKYKASPADIQGGRLTLTGIPDEYPNTRIQKPFKNRGYNKQQKWNT